MSFSDLMSSSRGPGVIGMLMATVVLIGFGTLFMFAFEPDAQGGGQTIQAVIRDQSKEIESITDRLNGVKKTLVAGEARRPLVISLTEGKASLEQSAAQIETGKQKISELKQDISQKTKDLVDYKVAYRQMVRGNAQGESIPEIKTLDGTVYKKVVLREVTAVGVQISHEDGIKRIPFELLPGDLQERFQYDSNEKEEALKNEAAERSQHDAAVEYSNKTAQEQAARKKDSDAVASQAAMKQEYEAKKQLLNQKEVEVRNLVAAIAAEKRKKLSRAPAMEAQLETKKAELAALRDRVDQLRSFQ